MVEDLGSTNGTLVNGRRIDEAVILRPGDILTIGSVDFRFEQQSIQDGDQHGHPPTSWSPVANNRQGEEPSAYASPYSVNQASGIATPQRSGANQDAIATSNEGVEGPQIFETPSPAEDASRQLRRDRPETIASNPTASGSTGAIDRAGDAESSEGGDVREALEIADRLPALLRQLVNELEVAQQRLDTDRELLEHSRTQLRQAQNQLEEMGTARDKALDAVETARTDGTMRDDIRAALEDSPGVAMSAPDEQSLHALLDSLIENPRDIGVLMSMAEHAAAIRDVVDAAHHQRQVLERIRGCVNKDKPMS